MLPIYRSRTSVFNYDEIPPGYYFKAMLEGHPVQRFWHNHKFQAIAERIPDGAKVLDVGCGPGSFLWVLGQAKPTVHATGVDIASSQIDFASREIGAKFPDERIQFVAVPETKFTLPFPDASFDVVTSIEVIEHIHPHIALRTIQEGMRVLKPEGKLIVSTPNYRSMWPFLEKLLERLSPVKYHEQHISKFTPNSLVKFLEVSGLELSKLESLFVAAPFLAPFSPRLAKRLNALERRLDRRLGHLLIAEAQKIDWTA